MMGPAADLLHSWGDARAVGYSTAQTLLLNASVAVACARAAPTCKRDPLSSQVPLGLQPDSFWTASGIAA